MITRIYKGFRKPFFWWLSRRLYSPQDCIPFYSFIFTDSCKYHIGEDQGDWNKLFGISDDINPHLNSYRIAWRYLIDEDMFELAPYYYINGVLRIHYERIKIPVNVKFATYIEFDSDLNEMIFNIDNKEVLRLRTIKPPAIYKELGLYFGGNRKAVKTMKFYKRRIM